MRTALLVLVLAAVCSTAEASPFAIRYGGSNTALVVDQGSIGRSGDFRSAWTYEFFRRGSVFVSPRLEILATRVVVNCLTHDRKDLASAGYLASGARLSATGPDEHWIESLRGSNTDLILTTVCEGPDEAWTVLRVPTVTDLILTTVCEGPDEAWTVLRVPTVLDLFKAAWR